MEGSITSPSASWRAASAQGGGSRQSRERRFERIIGFLRSSWNIRFLAVVRQILHLAPEAVIWPLEVQIPLARP
jgi:hypothetical protein